MAEPDNLVLEILKELRADLRELRQEMRAELCEVRAEIRAGFERVDVLEIKFDGLTHAVMSGFGGIVHELKDLNARVTMLEAERA